MAKVARKTLSRARVLRRKLTDAETMLWLQLRGEKLGVRFRRQHPVGPYVADFACVCASLVVEVDGATHSSDAERSHDARRDAFLRSKGWHVLRVWNVDVYDSLDAVVELIRDTALKRARKESGASGAPSTAARSPSPIR
jgi:very-short-patch-repair endonuclease